MYHHESSQVAAPAARENPHLTLNLAKNDKIYENHTSKHGSDPVVRLGTGYFPCLGGPMISAMGMFPATRWEKCQARKIL